MRGVALGVTLLMVAAVTAACGSDSDSGDGSKGVQLTVATQPDFFGVPLYLAVEKGFFEKQGIDAKIQEFPTGVEGTEAVVTGQADMTTVAAFPAASLASQGAPVKIIGTNAYSSDWWGFVTTDAIKEPQDLYGKKVAFQSNSTANFWFDRFVEQHQLDASKIEVVDAKFAQLVALFAKGDVDGIIQFEPNVTQAVAARSGSHVAWVGGDDGLNPLNGYVVAGQKVAKDREIGIKVLRALQAASEWMKANPDEVAEFAMGKTGIDDADEVKAIMAKIDFRVSFDDAALDQLQQVADYMLAKGLIKEPVKAADYVEADWAAEATK